MYDQFFNFTNKQNYCLSLLFLILLTGAMARNVVEFSFNCFFVRFRFTQCNTAMARGSNDNKGC